MINSDKISMAVIGKVLIFIVLSSIWCGDEGINNDPHKFNGMIGIPAGSFIYQTQDTIYLDEYYIDKYEVTIAQYDSFLVTTGHKAPLGWDIYLDEYDHSEAVRNITLEDARTYASWIGKRLPTEQEWEKAARGNNGLLYPWGNEYLEGMANCKESGYGGIAPVGSFPGDISQYGLYDTYGNVREWTETCKSEPCDDLSRFIIKGNDGFTFSPRVDLSTRQYWAKNTHFEYIGFRCVLDQ